MSNGGKRTLHERVKTAKRRSKSSAQWLERQLNDPYVKQAKEDGYRSRAAYKIIQIDDKFKIFSKGKSVVDLGAAPGGWTQVAVQRTKGGKVIGIDLSPIEPIAGATLIQHDFTAETALDLLYEAIGDKKVDIVMSDMAAPSSGHTQTDHLRIIYLCEIALDFAINNLKENGVFLAKILRGGAEKEIMEKLKKNFSSVKHYKPDSSRKDSSEMYVIASGFRS